MTVICRKEIHWLYAIYDNLYNNTSRHITHDFLLFIFGVSNFSGTSIIAIKRKRVDKITRARKMPEGCLVWEKRGGFEYRLVREWREKERERRIGKGYVRFAKTRFARLICGLERPSIRSKIRLWKSKAYPIQCGSTWSRLESSTVVEWFNLVSR